VFKGVSKEKRNSKIGGQIKNNISAINTGFFALGSILGPILGSVLEASIGYRTAFLIIGIIFALIALSMMFMACVYQHRWHKKGLLRMQSSRIAAEDVEGARGE
jgi:MFS family permease